MEPPGAFLAASWSLLGPLWALQGGSWDLLGASWAVLEATKTTVEAKKKEERFRERKRTSGVKLTGHILEAKINQNRIQNESKFKTIFKSEKVALQEPLGAVLGRSWGILEAILGFQKSLRYRQA